MDPEKCQDLASVIKGNGGRACHFACKSEKFYVACMTTFGKHFETFYTPL